MALKKRLSRMLGAQFCTRVAASVAAEEVLQDKSWTGQVDLWYCSHCSLSKLTAGGGGRRG